jgi:acyl dehydratase
MRFETPVTSVVDGPGPRLEGPYRAPAQMLADQTYDGHNSVHDDATAASLGLAGAPIEAPTHFSQIDPLAVARWGDAWFERGCVSCHFRTMVVEGEEVQATLTPTGETTATVEAHKADGTPVLTGTASIGADPDETELGRRLAELGEPGELFVIDRLSVGMRSPAPETASITRTERNGDGYPFSLDEKLAKITEPHPWYTADGGASSPWGRAIVPFEMISVLANKGRVGWPVRSPSLGLFLDLEVALRAPVFVDQDYVLERELVGLGQSRRTESYWTRTTITDADTGALTATVLLHSGVFKESYPGYPRDRLM